MNQDKDLIFGLRPVIEAIKAGKPIDRIIVRKGLQGSLYHELVTLLREVGIPYHTVPAERLDQYSRKNHQGVIAWISAVEYQNIENIIPRLYEEGKEPLILILNGVSDVRNFGAIARSAECFGVHAIILPEKGSARINADAVKTSAGALHSIPVCRAKSVIRAIEFLKESGLKIVSATEKSDSSITKSDLKGPLAVIMGSEDRGVSKEVLELTDETVSIPISGSTDSLNVSVAAGIILYEITRQNEISE
jgi:23S rRNA (guanosine2251-2'-O)-methyltransferase